MTETTLEQPNWHRLVWRLAIPVILSNISVPLLGMVDTAVMGQLDAP
jgi:MATE family multidrug resistance protein